MQPKYGTSNQLSNSNTFSPILMMRNLKKEKGIVPNGTMPFSLDLILLPKHRGNIINSV